MKKLGDFLARTRFTSRIDGLITEKNLKKYLKIAASGDIMLTRGNWNATNVGIPGFWKHMSVYLGTGKYLKKKFGIKHLASEEHYMIDAVGTGIFIKPVWEGIHKNDYLGVFRTHFSEEKKIRIFEKIFSHIGKEYDMLFNFYSDKSLVCSELVLKSYLPQNDTDEGMKVPLQKIGNVRGFPPHHLIGFAQENREILYPVFFIDSREKTGENFTKTPEELLETSGRARLTFFVD